ncbi:uncharacterized protein LOC134197369 [Corticium candelabrum]|uniref:uncharacterized protein LOC134197369 n=1 Tax=Corticium candelabrum TaxID=121492 RepID=UPI002E2738B8|nr:uncharacterized protein LOC134197369 [Corticium candelabrum]
MDEDGSSDAARKSSVSIMGGSGQHYQYGATAESEYNKRHFGGPRWGSGAWAILAVRIIMLAVIITCVCWTRIKWTCTSETIADLQDTTFLVPRTAAMLQGWKDETSKSFAVNFTKLNDRFKQRVEEMSEKLAKLQRDITDLVDSQGQQVDEIHSINSKTVAVAADLELMLTTNVQIITDITTENVTRLKSDLFELEATQLESISGLWSSVNGSLKEVAVVKDFASKGSEIVEELDETIPEGLSSRFFALLDGQQTLATVANTTSVDQKEANSKLSKNTDQLAETTNSIQTDALSATNDLKSKQQELRTGQSNMQQSQVSITEDLHAGLVTLSDILSTCGSTFLRPKYVDIVVLSMIAVFIPRLTVR